jgi:hypothetical protein
MLVYIIEARELAHEHRKTEVKKVLGNKDLKFEFFKDAQSARNDIEDKKARRDVVPSRVLHGSVVMEAELFLKLR